MKISAQDAIDIDFLVSYIADCEKAKELERLERNNGKGSN